MDHKPARVIFGKYTWVTSRKHEAAVVDPSESVWSASETRNRSAAGGACAGPPSKKALQEVHRRKRDKSATASRSDLVTARRDFGSAIQLQLGHALSRRRDHFL